MVVYRSQAQALVKPSNYPRIQELRDFKKIYQNKITGYYISRRRWEVAIIPTVMVFYLAPSRYSIILENRSLFAHLRGATCHLIHVTNKCYLVHFISMCHHLLFMLYWPLSCCSFLIANVCTSLELAV